MRRAGWLRGPLPAVLAAPVVPVEQEVPEFSEAPAVPAVLAVLVLVGLCASLPPAAAEDAFGEFASLPRAASPLPTAARAGAVDPLEWERLLRAPDSFGPAPLRAQDLVVLDAARKGRWAVVQAALEKGEADPRAAGERGLANVLVMAAAAGRDPVVRLLIQRGALIDRRGEDGFTPLGAAAFNGHVSTVRLLAKAGADPYLWSASGQGPLHLASAVGRVQVIDALLRLGIDPRAVNRDGDNALDVAASRSQLDAMERLIAAGVDPGQSGR